ncbi:MAG: hypothetical protein ACJ735_16760 [Actinomycetes bacterium]
MTSLCQANMAAEDDEHGAAHDLTAATLPTTRAATRRIGVSGS